MPIDITNKEEKQIALTGTQIEETLLQAHLSKSMLQTKTYYVSNNGLDINNGLTHLTPFKTIAKALTLISDYTTLKFECGSIFYESIIYENQGLVLESYGVGRNPILDGSSVINTPTLVSGNVWQTTNTYFANKEGNQGRVIMYEDGVPMQPVATQTECEALPNSYVTTTYDAIPYGTYTTMFRASSGTPISNGKKYITNTRIVIQPKDDYINRNNIKVKNIDAQYSFTPTPIDISHGYNNVIENSVSRYAGKHNLFIPANSIGKNLVGYGAELQGQYGRTASIFVAFHSSPDEGSIYTWENCAAIQDCKKVGVALGKGNMGFLEHTGASSVYPFKRGIFRNCYGRGLAVPFAGHAELIEANNCYFEKLADACIANVSPSTSIRNSFFQVNHNTVSTVNEYGNINYSNTTFINHKYANCQTANMILNNCLFYGGNSIRRTSILMADGPTNGALSLTMNNTIIFGYDNFTHGVIGTAYTGDYNIFFRNYGEIRAYYNGVQYQTLLAWQTATGQDANSVWLTPAQSKTFFLTDPNTGIVTINPYATVTASNGTVYTGTFPDGTLLTNKFTNKNYTHLKSKYVDELDLLQYQN